MNDNPIKELNIYGLGFVTGIIVLAIVLMITERTPKAERKRWEQKVIQHGYGSYVADPTNGVVTFVWK